MKSRKNTSKRGGGHWKNGVVVIADREDIFETYPWSQTRVLAVETAKAGAEMEETTDVFTNGNKVDFLGGSKRRSRKSRKANKTTKKGRGSHEGGKKKCPKHCRQPVVQEKVSSIAKTNLIQREKK